MRYIQTIGSEIRRNATPRHRSATDDLYVGITVSIMFAAGIVLLVRQLLPSHKLRPRLQTQDRILDPRERIRLGNSSALDYASIVYPAENLSFDQSTKAKATAAFEG